MEQGAESAEAWRFQITLSLAKACAPWSTRSTGMSLSIVPSLGVGDAGISCDVHTDFEKYIASLEQERSFWKLCNELGSEMLEVRKNIKVVLVWAQPCLRQNVDTTL